MLAKKLFIVVAVQILMLPLFSFLLTTSASAYPVLTEEDVANARLQFEDPDFITMQIPDKDISIRFIDSDPWDDDFEFVAEDYGDAHAKIRLKEGYKIGAGQRGQEVIFGEIDIDLYPSEQSTVAEDKGGYIDKSIFNAQYTRRIMTVNSNQPNQLIPTVRGRGDFTFSFVEEGYYKRDSEAGDTCQDVAVVSGTQVTVYELDEDGSPDAPDETQDTQCTVVGLNFTDRFDHISTALKDYLSKRINLARSWYRDDGSVNTSLRVPLARADLLSTPEASIPVADTGESGGGDVAEESCESQGAFSFILCPLIEAASLGIETLDNEIRQALNVGRDYYESEGVRDAWARFRNIASVLLIPILLVMVISTALGFQFVDAYTVKRAMPRLLAAVIFMSLSYDIARIMIEITNNVGAATGGLVAAPFGGQDNLQLEDLFTAGQGIFVSYGIIAGSIVAGVVGFFSIGIIASYLGVAFLSLIIIFVLLNVRELIIVFLMVLAPLAILSWVFPGNDKAWKLWWSTFTKLLLIYPLIVGMLMFGRGLASLVAELEASSGGASVFTTLTKLVFYIGPFFFIIAIFKYAGGVFANLAGMVNDRSKGVFDRQKKYRADKRKQLQHDLAAGNRFKGNKGLGKLVNRAGQNTADRIEAAKRSGLKGAFDSAAIRDANRKALVDHEKHAKEDAYVMESARNDDFLEAAQLIIEGMSVKEATAELVSRGYAPDTANELATRANAIKRQYGGHALEGITISGKAGAKTSYKNGMPEMLADIIRAAGDDEDLAMKYMGEAIGAAAAGGRHDLAGGSYGEKVAMLRSMMHGGAQTYTDEETGETHSISVDRATGAVTTTNADGSEIVTAADAVRTRQDMKALDSLGYGEMSRLHPRAAKNMVDSYNAEAQRLESRMQDTSLSESDRNAAARRLGELDATIEKAAQTAASSGNAEVTRIFKGATGGEGGTNASKSLSEVVYKRNEYGNIEHDANNQPIVIQRELSDTERARKSGYESVAPAQPGGPSQEQRQQQLEQQQNSESS